MFYRNLKQEDHYKRNINSKKETFIYKKIILKQEDHIKRNINSKKEMFIYKKIILKEI